MRSSARERERSLGGGGVCRQPRGKRERRGCVLCVGGSPQPSRKRERESTSLCAAKNERRRERERVDPRVVGCRQVSILFFLVFLKL